ncbi:tripartite tricarboxylate transporter TctB family protein [Piscinibacter sakaiensis]|uniref:Tricarboxylate transport protein TctB n=1 Tax=Piscinibacter sakaiensis TaxID=1547922 RepID=A0A0K8P260_PISS1|nr:tripartite tricarboxylate transporter TctB family protein [Piscinibacter sakaiensis]GAP36644.1 tricarboxylate transport protein TctB [Piscinibacter sakaiensis]
MRPKSFEDFWSGLMFTAAGAGFAIGATHYAMGSSARPGPGYFPLGLGLLLAVIGLVIIARSLARKPTDAELPPARLRPLVIIVAAIILFAITLPLLGIAGALPLLIIVVSTASEQFRWKEVLLNCVVLTVGSWAVFVKGLQLTLPVWPTFVS